jgi:hypothetical protein
LLFRDGSPPGPRDEADDERLRASAGVRDEVQDGARKSRTAGEAEEEAEEVETSARREMERSIMAVGAGE